MDPVRPLILAGGLNRWRPLAVGFLIIILLTSACSFRFMYRQLDWLVPWRLSEYVTFDSEQRSLLEQRLFKRLTWHCGTQLDLYAIWFRELKQAPQPFSREVIERYYWRTTEYWTALMQQLSPDIAALLQSASESQVEELFSNLEERNQELAEEYVTADWETVQERRVERMSKLMVRWIGPLNERQQKAVSTWAKELGQSGNEWIASRRRWQAALREALSLRADPDRFEARIYQLMIEPQVLWPDAYKLEYERMRTRTLDLLAEVSALQTPEQVRHLRQELGSWADDFEHLACSPPERKSTARSGE